MIPLGKPVLSKFDEFSEILREAFEPPHVIFLGWYVADFSKNVWLKYMTKYDQIWPYMTKYDQIQDQNVLPKFLFCKQKSATIFF